MSQELGKESGVRS